MWCSLSCKKLSSSSISEPSKLKNKIRVIHFNGYIEELEYPISVSELTSKLPTSHFLFTQSQLLSNGSMPLKLEAVLELGKVYFLLPFSLLDSKVSPTELAPIARKLASIAKNNKRSKSKSSKVGGNSPVCSSPAASPKKSSMNMENNDSSSKSRSWKPILSTIREISFNRRSESDLQD